LRLKIPATNDIKLKAQQVQSSLYRLMEAELVVANENKYQLAG